MSPARVGGRPLSASAVELRRLLADLHATELTEAHDRELAAAIAAARERLPESPRLRWYEGGEVHDNYSRYALFHGRSNPLAVPLEIGFGEVAAGVDGAIGTVTVDRQYEGPPRGVHGGYVAGLFDDMCGAALRLVEGSGAMTGRLTVRYRAKTPIDQPLRFEAWPTDVRSRRVVVRATCDADGQRTAEAEALFVRIDLRSVAEVQP